MYQTIVENGIELIKEINFHTNDVVKYERYFIDKFKNAHRDNNLPAIISYFQNGNIRRIWYCKYGKMHREGGPAYIDYYKNGKIKSEEYWFDGKRVKNEFKIMIIQGLY